MKNLILALILIFATTFSIQAQLKGVIVNSDNQPIEFANVALRTADSVFISGTTSNKEGVFELNTNNNTTKSYILTISYVGYVHQTLHLNNIPDKVDLGTIKLNSPQLDAVIVTAARSIAKIDRQLLFPSKQIVKTSTNGYDLLNKLILPGLKVDIVNKAISKVGGGSVPIYINDKKATQADVIALRPDEVLRVEYIDAPGVQYANDNAEAVVNFIVKRCSSGLLTGINTTNAITTGNGNNLYYLKYNHRLSEFGLNYSMDYSNVNERYTNQSDIYTLPNNEEYSILKKGINTYLKYAQHDIQLTYNLSVPDKYVFEANLRGTFYDSPDRGNKQQIAETGKPIYYALSEPTEKYHSPVLDLFYSINLPKKQVITANIVGTLIDTKYGYAYKTFTNEQFSNPNNEYGYNTDGKKYSLISELRYNKQFNAFTLTNGINHLEGYTKNTYAGDNETVNKMNNSATYLYSQISGKLNKLKYAAGVGLSYQSYKQDNDNYTYWLFRPSLTLSYAPFDGGSFRYRFYVSPNAPSLASLSNAKQQLNNMEFVVGNPNLKPYWGMTNTLLFSYQHKRFYIENTIGYTNSRKTIMEEINRKTNSLGSSFFEYGFDNQKSFGKFWNNVAGQYYVIPEKLTLQGGLSFQAYNSRGNNYSHTYSYFLGMFQADFSFGKWNIGANWNTRENSLIGETVSRGANYSNLYANYRLKDITLGLNWSYILSKNGSTSSDKTTNQFVEKEINVFVPDLSNMISISLSWNLSKGREHQSQDKTINNSDSDSGILKK